MSELGKEIVRLRDSGLSYNAISKTLGCSKSTVSYHCGSGQKEKSLTRTQEYRSTNSIVAKINRFRTNDPRRANSYRKSDDEYQTPIEEIQRHRAIKFQRARGKKTYEFTFRDVIEKLGENPVCHLTGRPIDLNKPSTYNLDHIVPRSQGGDNSLENLDIAVRQANYAKGDMLISEFLELCEDVLINFGYKIQKP